MGVDALLRGLVVIRHDAKCGIRTRRLCVPCVVKRLLGAVGSGSGDDRNAAAGRFHGELDDELVFGFA